MDTLPDDYFISEHQFTKATHRDQYESIDPENSDLTQEGKCVIITGATQGIGKVI